MLMNKIDEELKTKFLKVYTTIPDTIRSSELIAVIEKKPYTWDNAAIEIKNDTEIGQKILEQLKRIGII